MKKYHICTLVLVISFIFTVGCVTGVQTSQYYANKTQPRFDPYTDIYIVEGSAYYVPSPRKFFNRIRLRAILRGEIDKNGNTRRIDLCVIPTEELWSAYAANDIDGNNLNVRPVFPTDLDNTITSLYGTIWGVELSEKYLEDHLNSGLEIRLKGGRVNADVLIPKEYISGFLTKHRSKKNDVKKRNT